MSKGGISFFKKGVSNEKIIGTVIAILVVIFIFTVLRASSLFKGRFSKFQSEFKELSYAVEQDAMQRQSQLAGQTNEAHIYYYIANGIASSFSINGSETIKPDGTVSDLALNLSPSQLDGTEFYEIKNDTNIANMTTQKKFYDDNEKHYVTDNGEVFFLPGFYQEENGVKRWYVNDTKFYESDTPVTDISPINITNERITTNVDGTELAKTNIKSGTSLYIYFDADSNGEKATISPAVPFEITKNGTYSFTITVNGRMTSKSVSVNNYKSSDINKVLKIGDYIDYKPDAGTLKLDKSSTGYGTQTFMTENKAWRIIYIDNETGNLLLTPTGPIGNLYLVGSTGYGKAIENLNNICKTLYSNKKLGLTARCMNIDDANKIFNKVEPEVTTRYAFYPRGASVSGTINYNDNTYIKTTNEWRISRFYTNDGGGVDKVDSDGIAYKEPEVDNPVYVSQSFYSYNADENTNSAINSILGTATSWLSSQSVYLSKGAGFGMRTISSKGVNAEILYDSYANSSTLSHGFHPVVEVDYDNYTVNTKDSSRDGSTLAKAWRLVKD